MALKSGYFKQMLHVDLSAGSCSPVTLDDEFLETYVGGRGFGVKLTWENPSGNGT